MRRRVIPRARLETTAKPRFAQIARDHLCELDAGCRTLREPTTATRHFQCVAVAADDEQRQCVVDHLEPLRTVALADGDEANAKLLRRFELALDLSALADERCRTAAAAPRYIGQRRERRLAPPK